MGEFGRSGPQLPHDDAAQREHLKEVDEDLRRDREADRVAKGLSTRPRGRRLGYLIVLVGAAVFVASCFLPYNGLIIVPDGSRTVSIYEQLVSFGPNDGGSDVGALLFLFGGVATVAVIASMGATQRGPRPGPASMTAAVAAWSLTWIGLMIREATFGGFISSRLEWGFWVQAVSIGVVLVGTIVVMATARQERNRGTRPS